MEYLGHIISQQGVAVDPAKVKSVVEWPTPRNVEGVRGFLVLTEYYRKFIVGYGKIAKPLTKFMKKEGFNWGPKALKVFEELRRAIVSSPVSEDRTCWGGSLWCIWIRKAYHQLAATTNYNS